MKYEVYAEIRVTDDLSIFDFVSIGRQGDIPKRIEFTSTEVAEIVNLAFGDINENCTIDD